MSTYIPVQSIVSLIHQKKKGFKYQLCIRDDCRVVTYTSSKSFNNHIRNTKTCKGCVLPHVAIMRENANEIIVQLETLGYIQDGFLRSRKQRSDRKRCHKYPVRPPPKRCAKSHQDQVPADPAAAPEVDSTRTISDPSTPRSTITASQDNFGSAASPKNERKMLPDGSEDYNIEPAPASTEDSLAGDYRFTAESFIINRLY